ncbi:MAG: hypothetical protein R3E39_06315 [Anaerolineae bacterium]
MLLAPFEGRFSEIGYDAYYATGLALTDNENPTIELLAIDDGGSISSATARVRAIRKDPTVKAIVALGYEATSLETQQALDGMPMVIVGEWLTAPLTDSVFMLSSAELEKQFTVLGVDIVSEVTSPDSISIGGDVFAMRQFPLLNPTYQEITIASSASLPDDEFRNHFMSSGQYVQEPGLLATLTYDAAGMILEAMHTTDMATALASTSFQGLNGTIRFENGYWTHAPIHYFTYDSNGKLLAIDRPVEQR